MLYLRSDGVAASTASEIGTTVASAEPVVVPVSENPKALNVTTTSASAKESSASESVSSASTSAPGSVPNPGQVQSPSKVNRLDAISYLEQVKRTYADRPTVYNTFLEIMKEFKAQT